MSIVAATAVLLVLYLAWARRRLQRLERADEVLSDLLSENELDRIIALAEDLLAERARRRTDETSA
jgi:hypothetical protein